MTKEEFLKMKQELEQYVYLFCSLSCEGGINYYPRKSFNHCLNQMLDIS